MPDDKQKPRILVADDDPEVLRSVSEILDREGFLAVTARDGKEA
ncbi:MAG: response regulator [Pyrinomonadaceae bacterium]